MGGIVWKVLTGTVKVSTEDIDFNPPISVVPIYKFYDVNADTVHRTLTFPLIVCPINYRLITPLPLKRHLLNIKTHYRKTTFCICAFLVRCGFYYCIRIL